MQHSWRNCGNYPSSASSGHHSRICCATGKYVESQAAALSDDCCMAEPDLTLQNLSEGSEPRTRHRKRGKEHQRPLRAATAPDDGSKCSGVQTRTAERNSSTRRHRKVDGNPVLSVRREACTSRLSIQRRHLSFVYKARSPGQSVPLKENARHSCRLVQ